MYFPYLRGKQFELKALKDFFDENPSEEFIIPVIEPVNKSTRALESALVALRGGGHHYALIMNPCEGDFKHRNVFFSLPDDKPDLFSLDGTWTPAFICDEDAAGSVLNRIKANSFSKVMLIFPTGIDLDDDLTNRLINHESVRYIVIYFRSASSPRIRSVLNSTGKSIIHMEDCFKSKKRNADYADHPDEAFSSAFSFYRSEGYYGFSDYTALSSEVNDGGMLPYALAIHLTYQKSVDVIGIHHFVSDTNYDQTNIKGKFQEAALKIAPFFRNHAFVSESVKELIFRANDPDGFPGLGYLKKLSVKNHLELISHIQIVSRC